MFREVEDHGHLIACPHCGLRQNVTFMSSAVSVEQRCIGCHRYGWFCLPSVCRKLAAWLKGRDSV